MRAEPHHTGSSPPSKRPGCLFAAGAFLCLLGVGYVSTLLFQPQRLSDRPLCIGPYTPDNPYANVCDYAVNLQTCVVQVEGEDVCTTVKLEPGEGAAHLNRDLARVGTLLRVKPYACKLPYTPGKVRNAQTGRMEDGCVSP